jgi:hypothetical protein
MRTNRIQQIAYVQELDHCQESAIEFCGRNGISLASLKRWQKIHRNQDQQEAVAKFLPIKIRSGMHTACAEYTIHVGEHIRVIVPNTADLNAIEAILEMAVRICGRT